MLGIYRNLKLFLYANKITLKDLAVLLKKDKSTVSLKLSGKRQFNAEEMNLICKKYNLNMHEYFFIDEVDKTEINDNK